MDNNNKVKIDGISKLLPDLYEYFKDILGFTEDLAGVKFIVNKNNRKTKDNSLGIVLGSTGQYNPQTKEIGLYIDDRHPKDILRSFAHELIHFKQDMDDEFNTDVIGGDFGSGYAQDNDHLRDMEVDAYSRGNIMFRDWEDGIKSGKSDILYEAITNKHA